MLYDECSAGLVLGASLGGIAGSWTNPALGMILGADVGIAVMLIWFVISSRSLVSPAQAHRRDRVFSRQH
jgi:hypothetical protein